MTVRTGALVEVRSSRNNAVGERFTRTQVAFFAADTDGSAGDARTFLAQRPARYQLRDDRPASASDSQLSCASDSAMIGHRASAGRLRTRAGVRTRIAGFAYVALLPGAAVAVHQLRYWLAFGSKAGVELQRTGHSYLHSVVPWLVLLVALAVGCFLRALGRAFAGHTSPARFTLSLAGMWVVCSAALVAIFVCQESLEGLFATGHPAGWAGIFGYGGWWAVPAALCVGLALATMLHGARWLVREVARRRARPYLVVVGPLVRPARPRDAVVACPAPLVSGWSGRGPPTLN